MRFRGVLALVLVAALVTPLARAQEPVDWPNGRYNPYYHDPIRVFIDTTNLTNLTSSYAGDIRSAMAYWHEGGNNAIRWPVNFAEVAFKPSADIVVWFVEGDRIVCSTGAVGAGCGGFGGPAYTNPQGVVWLATIVPQAPGSTAQRQHYADEDVVRTAEHEFGHALGLPHSTDPNDVMYPESTVLHSDTPEARINFNRTLIALGAVVGGMFVLVGAQSAYGRYKTRKQREQRAARRPQPKQVLRVEIVDPGTVLLPPERIVSGGYVKNAACPASFDGAHRYEPRELVRDGQRETWQVCAACRHTKRL